jgi:hypothetical protein
VADLTRHQLSSLMLSALRREGLGIRDQFEGRQEPLSWFFRVLAYDQSELDILESGALDTLHAPSALIELVVDELALALANIGLEGFETYLARPKPELIGQHRMDLNPEVMLGFVHVDVSPPALWLDERESDPARNEALATRLADIAQEVGSNSDAVEVHIEGALEASDEWTDRQGTVRPAGVAVHFSFGVPLVDISERELTAVFSRGAAVAAKTVEEIRTVFRGDNG